MIELIIQLFHDGGSYQIKKQSIDLQGYSVDLFLYDWSLLDERGSLKVIKIGIQWPNALPLNSLLRTFL